MHKVAHSPSPGSFTHLCSTPIPPPGDAWKGAGVDWVVTTFRVVQGPREAGPVVLSWHMRDANSIWDSQQEHSKTQSGEILGTVSTKLRYPLPSSTEKSTPEKITHLQIQQTFDECLFHVMIKVLIPIRARSRWELLPSRSLEPREGAEY